MIQENEQLRRNEHVNYGAIVPGPSTEDEITPLLDAMDDPKIGISTQTLVSTAGSSTEPRRLWQFLAAISVTLGAFALGNVLSWTSPTEAYFKEKQFSPDDVSWIGATMAAGAATVVIPCGLLMDVLGRKKTMLLLVLPFVAGWVLLVFADDLWMFILGRFITGMMGGAFSLTAPAYTSEIADDKVRGMLGSFFQLMVTFGILFDYILGAAKVDVKILTSVCAAIPLVFGILFFTMPETPIQLLKFGKEEEARKSLQKFRGPHYDIDEEIRASKDALEKAEQMKLTFLQSFSTKAAKRGLFIAVGLMVFQQLSGVNAVIFYAAKIFEQAGSSMEANTCTVIVGVVQVVATFISTQIVDRLGRRILLLISDLVMSICCILLGVFFFLDEKEDPVAKDIGWLPLLSVCLFIVVFSLGYGPIPWMMVGELFPPNIKGAASSISCMVNWIIAFLVTKFFSNVEEALDLGPTFWIFAGISALGTIFVFFFVPETKGKSLAQIQRELGDDEAEANISDVPEKI
ncbi:Facilitated trehalose transporter Tret1 [Gryllus bimaculatus]|nr:Facilitated trehalose transporter Tret1 [Gryllus bimaculatus]